jgi:hypothetical protein
VLPRRGVRGTSLLQARYVALFLLLVISVYDIVVGVNVGVTEWWICKLAMAPQDQDGADVFFPPQDRWQFKLAVGTKNRPSKIPF